MRFHDIRGIRHGHVGVQREYVVVGSAVDIVAHKVPTQFSASDDDDVFRCVAIESLQIIKAQEYVHIERVTMPMMPYIVFPERSAVAESGVFGATPLPQDTRGTYI